MVIKREYDIKQLAKQLGKEIESSKKHNGVVKLDIVTALNISDVLQETYRREQRHQTLESALTFIEKEDGTQTNEMEGYNCKYSCFGNHDKDKVDNSCKDCIYEVDCRRVEERNKKKEKKSKESHLPDCFGYYEDENVWGDDCDECKYRVMCEKVEKGSNINE